MKKLKLKQLTKIKMKKILTIIALLFSMVANSKSIKDTVQINQVQVIGIKSEYYEPVTSSSICLDSITSYQGDDPFFILNKNTSVISQSDGGLPYGYSYMRIRGIDQTRINFSLNGIPLNEMEDQGIYFSNMPGFLNNISNINIERGIGSSKYGTTSIGGSVDLETETPIVNKSGFKAGYGSYNTQTLSLNHSTGYINRSKFAGSLNFSQLKSDGFRYHSGTNGGTLFGQIGYYGLKNTIKFIGFSGTSKNQMAWMPVDLNTLNLDYRTNLNSIEEKDNFNQNFASTTWINYAKSNLKFNSSIYFNNINGSYTSFLDTSTLGRFALNSYQAGAMSNMIFNFKSLTINTGLNYNYYTRQHRLSDNIDPTNYWYTNYGFKQDGIALVKLNWSILGYDKKNWNLFTDIQYRTVNFKYKDTDSTSSVLSHTWNFINPKIGIKYLSSKYEFWASLGKTSREVTRTDMFRGYDHLYSVNDSLISGFGDSPFIINFKPEQVYDFELGIMRKSDKFILSSNLYGMYFKNERVTNGEVNYIGLLLRNPVDKSYRCGVESDVRYTISKFTFGTNVNYSYNKVFINDDWYTHAFTPNFVMNNSVVFKNKIFFIGLTGRYLSKMYLDNNQSSTLSTPEYYIIDLNAGIQRKKLSISVNLNNLLNSKYYLPGGASTQSLYYSGALRNIFLTVSMSL